MLHPREREYVENPIKYEDKYGLDNAKMTRSRIRGRITQAFEDLILVIKIDSKGRNPTVEKLERDGIETKSRFWNGSKHQNPMFNHYPEVIKLVKISIDDMQKQDRQELIEFIKNSD